MSTVSALSFNSLILIIFNFNKLSYFSSHSKDLRAGHDLCNSSVQYDVYIRFMLLHESGRGLKSVITDKDRYFVNYKLILLF